MPKTAVNPESTSERSERATPHYRSGGFMFSIVQKRLGRTLAYRLRLIVYIDRWNNIVPYSPRRRAQVRRELISLGDFHTVAACRRCADVTAPLLHSDNLLYMKSTDYKRAISKIVLATLKESL